MKNNILLCFVLLFLSTGLNAQTGGPGQPEFMQFQQAGTSNLVNPATGTFSYQIPLFSIGGYPMNLTYQSGILMEDVSSMVGLGWNLNAGSIVRTLRGLPDDFSNDTIIKEFSIKENITYGGKTGADLEIAGLSDYIGLSVGAELGVFFNNYKGWGLEPSLRGSISACYNSNAGVGGSASLGMGVAVNSQSGVDKYISPSVGLKLGKGNTLSISLGKTWSVNSNEGLQTSINTGLSYQRYNGGTRKGIIYNKKEDNISDQSSFPLLGYSNRSYLNNSFNPDIDYPFINISGTYSGTIGWDAYYVDPSLRITGYYSIQRLATKTQYLLGIGSMYETKNMNPNTLMDFNREKKLPYYIGESKILPIPYKTPDIFNLNAQGLSMTFSVCKNDIGVVGDAQAIINSDGTQAGIEANFGNIVKAGLNYGTTNAYQTSGRWNPTKIAFKEGQEIFHDTLYRQFCLKNHGEINKFNHSAFTYLGSYNPVYFPVTSETTIAKPYSYKGFDPMTKNLFDTIQPVRQSTINYLNAAEASVMGLDKKLNYFSFDNISHSINRIDPVNIRNRKANHLSEISVTQPDGMKYVFGIPVYNTVRKEVTFNVNGNPANVDRIKNLVGYTPGNLVGHTPGTDNSTENIQGTDNFFEATTTPAYVTQFLITAVLSPDYRDITDDGVTEDDLGNYVKFNYYKEDSLYQWRTPVGLNQATYNRGLRSDDQDDKGTYLYGKKELWYVHSMESKTEIALFYYSKRTDGYGVLDENGGKNTNNFLRKLDSLKVYSLPDYKLNSGNALPIKTIHFGYDNSLCEKTENGLSSKGKLTLKKVAFTYENSKKGKNTPYVFKYGIMPDGSIKNPDYNVRNVNRWGYYQSNPDNAFNDCDNSALSNIDYPYASQDKDEMDKNAYAWNLTDITIPGGGKLKVDYEAHDYAYIQDKTAGQMFIVSGVGDINGNLLYNNSSNDVKSRIYFKLFKPIIGTTPEEARKELRKNYLNDMKDGYLYYKFYIKLKGDIDLRLQNEYITGYAVISNYGVSEDGNFGFVELVPADLDDERDNGQCNPILKTALQFMRINRNKLIFSNNLNDPGNITDFAQQLPQIMHELNAQIEASNKGVNAYCISKGFCQNIDLTKSFIRLYNPLKMKIAGGSRVKSVSINDSWAAMAGNSYQDKAYTTDYYYTTTEKDAVNQVEKVISSGVADYEPMTGGDEISLKQPIFYSDIRKKAPDNDYYVEEPVNESLFPAPQIIYGKVTQVTNKTTENVGKTGKIVNEYFTSKDYPVKVNRTAIDEKRDKTNFNSFQLPFVASDQQHDFATVSQGYSIELNNMSGLPKATWVYNENGDRISGEEMKYALNNDNFITIDQYGGIHRNTKLGLSVEYTIDGRKSYDQSVTDVSQLNLNISTIGPIPVPLMVPLFSEMKEEKQFQSFVTNKVIHRNALLKSKTVYDQSASVTTENLAFDEVTGEALLTKTTNEFNDTLFSFKYPAYWMYNGMGPAYSNTKLKLNASNLTSYIPFLKKGDELRSESSADRLWFMNSINQFEDAYKAPASLSSTGRYQIYNSGAKNLLSAGAGQVVTWNYNPVAGSKINFIAKSDTSTILNSSAIQYADSAVIYCDSCRTVFKNGGINEYLSGQKGSWKPKKTWFYLTERTPGKPNNITDIRRQGLFDTYNDFWKLPLNPPSQSWQIDSTNWEWKEKVNLTDVDGMNIETEDRIGRKVANLLGYSNTLITAQTSNAAYHEAFFDGFEDYNFSYCTIPQGLTHPSQIANNNYLKRVKLTSGTFVVDPNESHTGKYSIKVSESLTFTGMMPDILYQSHSKACTKCIGGFFPEKNKKYVFSCWVKVKGQQPVLSCSDASVIITNGGVSITLKSEGAVIEGWQRILGTFKTPLDSNDISVTLNNANAPTFYDDIRIFPDNGNMVSYVYDDVNLRLTNILDENNYFTKYEYNNQGELIRIKKESERGIFTLKEANQALVKQP